MEFYDKVIDQLRLISSKTKDEDDSFIEFMIFFGQEYEKLSKKEQKMFNLMIDRDKKLCEILGKGT